MKKLTLILICIILPAAVLAQEPPAGEVETVDRLIEQLGSQEWRQREHAQKKLEEIGEPALEKLKEASGSEDPEKASRAQRIIDRIEETLAVRRVETLTEKALETLRPGRKVQDVEREVFRKIAEAVIELRGAKDAPVVKPREVLEKEPEAKGGVVVGKIGVAWGTQGARTVESQLSRYRYVYGDALNLMLVLAASDKGRTPQEKARLAYQVRKPATQDVIQRLLEFCGSEDTALRLTAMMRFSECANEKYKTYFLNWLEDPLPQARQFAANALYGFKSQGGVPEALKKVLADKDYLVRRCVVRAIGASEDPGASGILLPMLQDKSFRVRMAAASALSHGPVEKVRDALLKALNDKSEHVITAAITSLGVLKDVQAADKVAKFLDAQSLQIKRAAVNAVARIGNEEHFEKLVEIGSGTDHLWYVIAALRESANPLVYPVLEKILAKLEENPGMEHFRATILETMLNFNKEKTRRQVLNLFNDTETESRYKGQLIRLLKISPDKAVIEALIEQLDSQDLNLQTQSLEALRYLTARELDSAGYRTLANDEQRKQQKKEWLEWWTGSKETFSFEKAADARTKKMESLLAQAKEMLSKSKYQEARTAALSARRLEPGRKEIEEIIRKASFLLNIKREMDLHPKRK